MGACVTRRYAGAARACPTNCRSCRGARRTPRSFLCGNDDPAFHSQLSVPTVTVGQEYHTEEHFRRLAAFRGDDVHGRDLQTLAQSYGSFIPLSTMNAMGSARPMRIAIVWDVVDSGDTISSVTRQCTSVGQGITVQSASGSDVAQSNFCTATHLVTGSGGSARGAVMRARTEAARQYWQRALVVRPVLDSNLTIHPSVVSAFGLTTTRVANADLVIVMTARPSPFRPVAGYASCRQRDQYGRCTVGACAGAASPPCPATGPAFSRHAGAAAPRRPRSRSGAKALLLRGPRPRHSTCPRTAAPSRRLVQLGA